MNDPEKAQIIVVIAVLLVFVLILMAAFLDGARLLVTHHDLNRAADAAGKAGLLVAADQMVTQAVSRQTAAASATHHPGILTAQPSQTPSPALDDILGWLTDSDRSTLAADPVRTRVADQVIVIAESNQSGPSHPQVTKFEINYPYHYHPGDPDLRIRIRIQKSIPVIFGNLFGCREGIITGDAQQRIPQR